MEVGRAIATHPAVLLLDEPAAGLDDTETEALAAVLSRVVSGEGTSLVLVEHNLGFLLDLAEPCMCWMRVV